MKVNQNIIDKRNELGLTQKAVADDAGISRGAYAAIERGLRYPSLDTALRICAVLSIPVEKAFPITETKARGAANASKSKNHRNLRKSCER